MAQTTHVPTTEFQRKDRCAALPHRPRVLLGKMGLDGHDRGVKVIARALRDSGVHVIYSGLWQTPKAIAIGASNEDCDVVMASMMSNSHLTLGPALLDALGEAGRPDTPVYMGGILPKEDLPALLEAGIKRCFTTGVGLLEIVDAVRQAVRPRVPTVSGNGGQSHAAQLARDISRVHEAGEVRGDAPRKRPKRVIGITGAPGAGKSTLVAQLAAEHSRRAEASGDPGRVAVVAFDPMSPITGGALLGDRLRVDFNALGDAVFYRSLAIGGQDYKGLDAILELVGGSPAGYETVLVETVGAGQNDTKIREHVDRTAVVLTPGMGDAVQMDKAGILEIADMFVCNKADFPGEHELVRDLCDVAGKRPILETVATRCQGVSEFLDLLLTD